MFSRRSSTVGTIAAPDGSLTNSELHRRTAWSSLKSTEGIRLSERPVYSFRKRVVWTTCRPVIDEFWAFRPARSHRGSTSQLARESGGSFYVPRLNLPTGKAASLEGFCTVRRIHCQIYFLCSLSENWLKRACRQFVAVAEIYPWIFNETSVQMCFSALCLSFLRGLSCESAVVDYCCGCCSSTSTSGPQRKQVRAQSNFSFRWRGSGVGVEGKENWNWQMPGPLIHETISQHRTDAGVRKTPPGRGEQSQYQGPAASRSRRAPRVLPMSRNLETATLH